MRVQWRVRMISIGLEGQLDNFGVGCPVSTSNEHVETAFKAGAGGE